MFQVTGVFAEFELHMIVERVRAGVARAKASGTKSGRAWPAPYPALEVELRIREALVDSCEGRDFIRSPPNSEWRPAQCSGSRLERGFKAIRLVFASKR